MDCLIVTGPVTILIVFHSKCLVRLFEYLVVVIVNLPDLAVIMAYSRVQFILIGEPARTSWAKASLIFRGRPMGKSNR
jgi:hypothetical protein